MTMSMIKWVVTTSERYQALQPKENNALYFLQDTREIYKGSESFTQATELVTGGFPSKGAQGRVYIDTTNLEGRVWNGSQWKTVIQPIASVLTDEAEETKAVSGNAVKAYVKQQLATEMAKKVDAINYDKEKKQLTYNKGDQATTVDIGGFVTGVKYNPQSGILSFDVQGDKSIHINLPKDNVVESGRYDKDSKNIILTLGNGELVEIPAADLIDETEFGNTNTVEMSVSEDTGMVTANVKVSQDGDNQLTVTEKGLYVAPTNLDGKLDKVAPNKAKEIIIAKADGSVEVSGLKAGTDVLEGNDVHTLATEAAVAAIKATLEQTLETKFDKINISKTLPGALQASDEKVASEKAVATAIDALKDAKIDRTNIIESISETSKSTEKVASEAAVVAALSWVEI